MEPWNEDSDYFDDPYNTKNIFSTDDFKKESDGSDNELNKGYYDKYYVSRSSRVPTPPPNPENKFSFEDSSKKRSLKRSKSFKSLRGLKDLFKKKKHYDEEEQHSMDVKSANLSISLNSESTYFVDSDTVEEKISEVDRKSANNYETESQVTSNTLMNLDNNDVTSVSSKISLRERGRNSLRKSFKRKNKSSLTFYDDDYDKKNDGIKFMNRFFKKTDGNKTIREPHKISLVFDPNELFSDEENRIVNDAENHNVTLTEKYMGDNSLLSKEMNSIPFDLTPKQVKKKSSLYSLVEQLSPHKKLFKDEEDNTDWNPYLAKSQFDDNDEYSLENLTNVNELNDDLDNANRELWEIEKSLKI